MEHILVLSLRGQVLALIPVSPTLSAADRDLTATIYGADAAVIIPRRVSPEPTRAESSHTGEDVDTWCDRRQIDSALREAIRAAHDEAPWRLLRDVARDVRESQEIARRRKSAALRRRASL